MATAELLEPTGTLDKPRLKLRRVVLANRSPKSWPAIACAIALSLLAGVLHAISWLFPGAWQTVWLGQALLIFVAATHPPRVAFCLGFLGGSLAIALSFHWGIAALQMTIDANVPLAYSIFLGLVTVEGLSFALFCLLVSLARRGGLVALCLVPFLWATIEAWYPRIFPWQMGYSQLELLPLLQIAEVTGSVGIGFVMSAVAAVPTIIVLTLRSQRRSRHTRFAAGYTLAAATLLLATLLYGEVRQRQWSAWLAQQPKMKVAAVQVDPAFLGAEEKMRQLTMPIRDQVDLICWPESSIGVYSESLSHFRDVEQTRQLSRDSWNSLEPGKDFQRHLLAGGKIYRHDATEHGPYSMTAFLIGPHQDILGRYRKRTLLPFGEYVPGQSVYPAIREWFTIRDVMIAGSDPAPLVTDDGRRLGVLICYEDMLPGNARQTAAAGAQAFFSLIQGTAFENPLTLRQHQRLAVMRAVENRRFFVRCASTGVTCVIEPTGRIIAELPVNVEDVLLSEIAPVEDPSFYMHMGNAFAWLCSLVTVAGMVVVRTKAKKESKNPLP